MPVPCYACYAPPPPTCAPAAQPYPVPRFPPSHLPANRPLLLPHSTAALAPSHSSAYTPPTLVRPLPASCPASTPDHPLPAIPDDQAFHTTHDPAFADNARPPTYSTPPSTAIHSPKYTHNAVGFVPHLPSPQHQHPHHCQSAQSIALAPPSYCAAHDARDRSYARLLPAPANALASVAYRPRLLQPHRPSLASVSALSPAYQLSPGPLFSFEQAQMQIQLARSQQQPSYVGLLTTAQEAITLLAACDLSDDTPNHPPRRIPRRLLESERAALVRSGNIFVWDEREAGIRRWTDGRVWSASRVHGCFLTYRELLVRKQYVRSPTAPASFLICS